MASKSNANTLQWYKRGKWFFENQMDRYKKIRKVYYK